MTVTIAAGCVFRRNNNAAGGFEVLLYSTRGRWRCVSAELTHSTRSVLDSLEHAFKRKTGRKIPKIKTWDSRPDGIGGYTRCRWEKTAEEKTTRGGDTTFASLVPKLVTSVAGTKEQVVVIGVHIEVPKTWNPKNMRQKKLRWFPTLDVSYTASFVPWRIYLPHLMLIRQASDRHLSARYSRRNGEVLPKAR